jgi:hypothetical protein
VDGGWGYGEGMWNKDKSNLVGALEPWMMVNDG